MGERIEDIRFWLGMAWDAIVAFLPILFLLVVFGFVYFLSSPTEFSAALSNLRPWTVVLTIAATILVTVLYGSAIRFFGRTAMIRLLILVWCAMNLYGIRALGISGGAGRQFVRGLLFVLSVQCLLWAMGIRSELFGNQSEEEVDAIE